MAKGKAKVDYLNMQGFVGLSEAPDYSYIYETSTVKSEKWNLGDRVALPDGRVFRYAYATGALSSGFGAANIAALNIGAVLPAAAAVGDKTLTVTIASGDGYAGDGVIAEDELRGAYIVIGHGETKVQNRQIIGNTAVASGGGTSTVYLDAPLTIAMTASSSYCEIMLNPYAHLSKGAYEYNAFMGVPVTNVSASNYCWVQTWGPCWVTPGGADSSPGDTANDRQMYFVGDGSVNGGYALTIESGYQKAGFIIDSTASGTSAAPFLMLQIAP